jgi:nucleoside-diphosphate-sugar epimerase
MTDSAPPLDRPHLLVFGLGYSARRIAHDRLGAGWRVSGTTRSRERVAAIEETGIRGLVFDGEGPPAATDEAVRSALADCSHLLVSAPPGPTGDPVLSRFREDLVKRESGPLGWIGYLSTTGVYGDHQGGWVDETTDPAPGLERTRRRLEAEEEWSDLARATGAALQIFRISGIYGPGRSALDGIRSGRARTVVKQGSVFNRIHVDDLAGIVLAGMARPDRPGVYNVSDDLPAPNHEVQRYAAGLLGVAPPPEVPFEEAGLSPMGASFYAEDRRVRNDRVKEELGYRFRHPTYREGLAALLEREGGDGGTPES